MYKMFVCDIVRTTIIFLRNREKFFIYKHVLYMNMFFKKKSKVEKNFFYYFCLHILIEIIQKKENMDKFHI